ncbi:MAG: endolytic transglycosylase MltG [Gammaproteobacteria bacterium]
MNSKIISGMALTVIFIFILFFYFLNRSFIFEEEKIVFIEPGSSLNEILIEFKENKITSNLNILKAYILLSGKSKSIQSGEFLIKPDSSLIQIVNKIENGDIFYRNLRFKEGDTWHDLRNALKNEEYLVYDLPKDSIFLNTLTSNFNNLEGLFHPDTYFYKRGDKASEILIRAYKLHQKILDKAWEGRSLNISLSSKYEALILASIIEKEGIERNKISGVFNRRINLKMKLQSDPTVIYALGDQFDGDIKRSDLKIKHPYNTYVYKGLPPGPIGLASQVSLEASVNPKEGTSLYFVSKGDGSHKFSDTLEEHNKAVRDYQLNKK